MVVYMPGCGCELDPSHQRMRWNLEAVPGPLGLITLGWDTPFYHEGDKPGPALAPFALKGDGYGADKGEFDEVLTRAALSIEALLGEQVTDLIVIGQLK